jgi:hypothetical protein
VDFIEVLAYQMLNDDEIKKKVEARKYKFYGASRESKGLKVTVGCPEHPDPADAYTISWDNFNRTNDPTHKGGCPKCSQFGTGRKPKTALGDWSDSVGLYCSTDYSSQKKDCTWVCKAQDHAFVRSYDYLNKLYKSETAKGNLPVYVCPLCEIAYFEDLHQIIFTGDRKKLLPRGTSLDWQCDTCEATFSKPIATMSRVIHPCNNPTCLAKEG